MRVCRREFSGVDLAILQVVQDHPHSGLGDLALEIGCADTYHVRSRLIRLRQAGLINVEIPRMLGRGHKIIIRKAASE